MSEAMEDLRTHQAIKSKQIKKSKPAWHLGKKKSTIQDECEEDSDKESIDFSKHLSDKDESDVDCNEIEIKNQVLSLDVGGEKLKVSSSTLLYKAPESKLSEEFRKFVLKGPDQSELICQEDESIFVDRNAEIFKMLLDFLRNDMKSMPIGLNQYKLNLFEQELEFWNI